MLLINRQSRMWLEEEMLLSILMFSATQVNTSSITPCFSRFFCVLVPSLYLVMLDAFQVLDVLDSILTMLLLLDVIRCSVCAIQQLVVVVVVIVEPQGLQVIAFIQSLPYCGCSCSHLPCIGSREAARECRRKKKEYVKCLENRVAVLENQNKTLIEELKALKDLYCHKAE